MILENIKKETAKQHEQLEQSPLLSPITSPSLDKSHYAKVLRSFYGFFKPLEEKITQMDEVQTYLPDMASRRKAAYLKDDLHQLGYHDTEPSVCQELPQVTNTAQALGALYVMEGSTLGGRFIAKSLKKNLNIDPENGASFFHGYGTETGSRWKSFQQALVSFSEQTQQDQEVIKAANETFEKFEHWVNREHLCH